MVCHSLPCMLTMTLMDSSAFQFPTSDNQRCPKLQTRQLFRPFISPNDGGFPEGTEPAASNRTQIEDVHVHAPRTTE